MTLVAARVPETTLPMPRSARTIQLTERRGKLRIDALAGSIGDRAREALTTTVAHMFRLDENLVDFYKLVGEDGQLSWSVGGAGRMLRAPTVSEDVVKTICTLIRSLSPQNRGCTGSANSTLGQTSLVACDCRTRAPGDSLSRSSRIRTSRRDAEESIRRGAAAHQVCP